MSSEPLDGLVVWLTGLPSSGKSTLARKTAPSVRRCVVLDSDEVRAALTPPPGYDDASREAFYETLAKLAALLARQGLVVLVPATANLRRYRDRARELAPAFLEVFVDTPVSECRRRDPKGLYAAQPATLPGVGAPYQPPLAPDLVVTPEDRSPESTLALLIRSRQVT